jgi:AcrR family transcriptional regulator
MTVVTETQPTRRERNKTAVRARILDAAIGLFSERSIETVTVDQIALAADVGKGTIYNYFHTKEDIVVAFMAEFERKVQEKIRKVDITDRPLAEALTEILRLQFRMKKRYHKFVRAFFAQMFLHTAEFLPHMAEIHRLTVPTVESVLETLQKRGSIRADASIAELGAVFINIHFGLSALWAIEGPPFRATAYAMERQITFFCEGIEERKS